MFIIKDYQKIYLCGWNYNAARIITELVKVAENHGATVKPCGKIAVVVDRTKCDKITEEEENLVRYKSLLSDPDFKFSGCDSELKKIAFIKKAIKATEEKIQELSKAAEKSFETSFLSYVTFKLDNMIYYYQVDDNPFFPFYWYKTPIKNGMYSRDAMSKEDKKEWFYDCFFKSECSDSDIVEAANLIFNMLVSAPVSEIWKDSEKRRVSNLYDGGYHYERITRPERLEKVDF